MFIYLEKEKKYWISEIRPGAVREGKFIQFAWQSDFKPHQLAKSSPAIKKFIWTLEEEQKLKLFCKGCPQTQGTWAYHKYEPH